MSKTSAQNIAINEAIVASAQSPELVAAARDNVDLWLSIDGLPGKYGTQYARTAVPAAPAPALPPAPAVRTYTTPAPRGQGAFEREEQVRRRTARIIEATGIDPTDARYRAEVALAVEHGEAAPVKPLDKMTATELAVHLSSMPASVLGLADDTDDVTALTDEQVQANLEAWAAEMSYSRNPEVRIDINRSALIAQRNGVEAAARAARDKQYRQTVGLPEEERAALAQSVYKTAMRDAPVVPGRA